MIKLYGPSVSPFVRKVVAALKLKNLDFEWDQSVTPRNLPENYQELNHLKKVPAMSVDNFNISDSSVMCDYLENKFPNSTALLPKNPEDRAKALWFEEYADSKLFELLGKGLFFERIVKPMLLDLPTDEEVLKNTLNSLPNELQYLENSLNGDFLVGNSISIADISVATFFINAQYAQFTVDANKYPKLDKYLTNILNNPALVYCLGEDQKLFASLQK
ncbi:glutathione S-transferase family protein [Rickettsiales bacterium LUAb2]